MVPRLFVRAFNGRSSAARLLRSAGFVASLAATFMSNDSAAADRPKGVSRSKHADVLYGSQFNAGTSVLRPPVALRRAGEAGESLKFKIKFTGDFPDDAKAAFLRRVYPSRSRRTGSHWDSSARLALHLARRMFGCGTRIIRPHP
jgi:hypothetical protein